MHPRCHLRSVLPLHTNHLIVIQKKWGSFYTMITLLIPYIILDFIEDIVHTFPQVFNLARLISQKHNIKDKN